MMGKIDLSSMQGPMNHMVLQLAIFLLVPLISGLAVKFVLKKFIRLPNSIANIGSLAVCFFVFYKMLFILGK
jgi:hypothetical protein